jgi:hypothetical protein
MQVETVKWNAFQIQTGFSYILFYLLFSIEYAFILTITDFLSSPTTGEYALFMMFVAARCLFTCVTVLRSKGLLVFKSAFLFCIGATTAFWISQLSIGLFSYTTNAPHTPSLLAISDVVAIGLNLLVLLACLLSANRGKHTTK